MAGSSNTSRSSAAGAIEELFSRTPRDGFSLRPNYNFKRQPPGAEKTMLLGGQWYRVIDNGRAIVLEPIHDPMLSDAEFAQQQEAVRRVVFDANNTMAGVAVGFATLAGAPPRVVDAVRAGGAVIDTALQSRIGSRPPRLEMTKAQVAAPTQGRPSIRYGRSNSKGQATGVNATLTPSMLGTGSKADRRIQPPGWSGNGTVHNESRGHLLANSLGGDGRRAENLVTLTQTPSNSPKMRGFEHSVLRRVKDGEVIEYVVTPLYGDAPAPRAVLLTAQGPKGGVTAKVVGNPAGHPKSPGSQ